jgi:flagellar biosynthesis/type III secretory pathway chaperone
MMDPGLCREHLAEIVAEELQLLAQLEQLLQEERDVIASGDLKGLQRSTERRQERMGGLARLESQRASLSSMHGQSTDPKALERLLAWCDPRGMLRALFTESRERAMRCRQLNDRNGAMVRARLTRVSERLQVLRGGNTGATTYGPRGALARTRGARVLGSV